jgi:multidrug resistance efflux pump
MKVDPLPPIPSPPAHLWRQFRVRALPGLAFLGVLVATLALWKANQENPMVMGTAQGLEADIASPGDASLVELSVVRYQEVRRGDLIAVLQTASPDVASNSIAVLKAEMALVRSEAGYDAGDRIRYGQFQLDWMLERADLAVLQQQLTYAEAEYERAEQLLKKNIAEPSLYDIALRDLRQARELLDAKTVAVETARLALDSLNPEGVLADTAPVAAALDVVATKLRLLEAEFEPVRIHAPIDGRVSKIYKLPGTTVAQGEPILTLASPDVDHILGYIREPIRVEPTRGMEVQVQSRGLKRTSGFAKVTEVGPRIELFNAPLRTRGMGNAQQRGLPILVSIPPNMQLLPGELVDLWLIPSESIR